MVHQQEGEDEDGEGEGDGSDEELDEEDDYGMLAVVVDFSDED